MGYMPYATLLAQQFPWCGTLRLRGQAAEDDVKIALFELAAAQLDVVANVKRAYYDLHFNELPSHFSKRTVRLPTTFSRSPVSATAGPRPRRSTCSAPR